MRHPLFCVLVLLLSACAGAPRANDNAAALQSSLGPDIQTEDVTLFYRVYEAAAGRPSAEQLQRDYLDAGSDGLRTFAAQRRTTAARIAEAIARQPETYESARRCANVLPRVRERLRTSTRTLAELYPDARLPPVTLAIGRGRPVAIGSPVTGLQIGVEALCAADFLHADLEDRFVYVIAHEYAHVQQAPALAERADLTVLERSLLEGAAEFICELIAGDVAYAHLRTQTAGREAEIETSFVADMDRTDFSNWLDNTGSHPSPDLGYWVGYRIV
ncbi:MAG: DUF2268 domain-containing putative Zn-dependent protease, partial [Vitreimonas sp.]